MMNPVKSMPSVFGQAIYCQGMRCGLYLAACREPEPNIVWNRPGVQLGFFWLLTFSWRLTPAFGGWTVTSPQLQH
jgi:hypothetical protein